MSDDMGFIEGCYRLENGRWQVVTAIKREGVPCLQIYADVVWDSGVTGMNVIVPKTGQLNANILLRAMSDVLGVDSWIEVRGPDSMVLR